MNSQREAFEEANPRPENVWWSGERGRYVGVSGNLQTTANYQGRWEGWQAATEQGVGEAVAYGVFYSGVMQEWAWNEDSAKEIAETDFPGCGCITKPIYTHPPKPTGGGVPEGHVIAPIEPTDDMVYASNPDQAPSEARESRQIIKAALSLLASQQPPEQE